MYDMPSKPRWFITIAQFSWLSRCGISLAIVAGLAGVWALCIYLPLLHSVTQYEKYVLQERTRSHELAKARVDLGRMQTEKASLLEQKNTDKSPIRTLLHDVKSSPLQLTSFSKSTHYESDKKKTLMHLQVRGQLAHITQFFATLAKENGSFSCISARLNNEQSEFFSCTADFSV